MPWQAISYVGTGVSLAAFLAATIAWVFKSSSEQRERLIQTANEADRPKLISDALEFFRVDTDSLTKAQRYDLAIRQIKERASRFLYIVITTAILSVLAAAVALFAMAHPSTKVEQPQPSFDVSIKGAKFFKVNGRSKVEITLAFTADESNQNAYSTIFTGMMAIDDEDKILSTTRMNSSASCADVPYCLVSTTFHEYENAPLIVRGVGKEVLTKAIFNLPSEVKLIRVWVEFYQRETIGGNKCVLDKKKSPPKEGIPYLVVSTPGGRIIKGFCLRAYDREIFPVQI